MAATAAAVATYSLAIPGLPPIRELKRDPTTPPPERWCDGISSALIHMQVLMLMYERGKRT